MKGNETKITALYCRLLQDDGNVGDSMSIQSQKAILESSAYIEVFFPQHHVRYITVNDGIDSKQIGGLDITPFKNILNEFLMKFSLLPIQNWNWHAQYLYYYRLL